MEAGLHGTNQELGSTISLQVTTAWVSFLTVFEGLLQRLEVAQV